MLHCTACRSGLAPFSFYRPFVDKSCPTCGAQLRIHRRGRRSQEVEGPALPPKPAEVEFELTPASPGAYRQQPAESSFQLRWRDSIGAGAAALLGGAGALTTAGLIGAIFVGPPALVLCIPGGYLGIASGWISWPGGGRLVLGVEQLVVRQRVLMTTERSIPREAIRAVRVVGVIDESSGGLLHFRVLARLTTGEWALLARPRSSAVAHFVAASLRQALEIDTE